MTAPLWTPSPEQAAATRVSRRLHSICASKYGQRFTLDYWTCGAGQSPTRNSWRELWTSAASSVSRARGR